MVRKSTFVYETIYPKYKKKLMFLEMASKKHKKKNKIIIIKYNNLKMSQKLSHHLTNAYSKCCTEIDKVMQTKWKHCQNYFYCLLSILAPVMDYGPKLSAIQTLECQRKNFFTFCQWRLGCWCFGAKCLKYVNDMHNHFWKRGFPILHVTTENTHHKKRTIDQKHQNITYPLYRIKSTLADQWISHWRRPLDRS